MALGQFATKSAGKSLKNLLGIYGLPRAFYCRFLIDDGRGSSIYENSVLLKEMLKYAEGKEIKKKILDGMRDESFRNLPSSFIVREIIGLFVLFSGIFRYLKLTIQIKWMR